MKSCGRTGRLRSCFHANRCHSDGEFKMRKGKERNCFISSNRKGRMMRNVVSNRSDMMKRLLVGATMTIAASSLLLAQPMPEPGRRMPPGGSGQRAGDMEIRRTEQPRPPSRNAQRTPGQARPGVHEEARRPKPSRQSPEARPRPTPPTAHVQPKPPPPPPARNPPPPPKRRSLWDWIF